MTLTDAQMAGARATTARPARHAEGSDQSYVEELKRQEGPDADQPHRLAYETLVPA